MACLESDGQRTGQFRGWSEKAHHSANLRGMGSPIEHEEKQENFVSRLRPDEQVTRVRDLALFLTGLHLAASVHLSF